MPFFIAEKEIGKEVFGLPKMIGVSKTGYIEWQEIGEHSVCDFEDYTFCRDPPIIQIRINNMCLEQLISTNRSFHCRIRDSLYAPPHFEKIGSGLMALSTSKPTSCATGGSFHIFKNLSIIQLGCNESLFCEGSINFVGNRHCQKAKPYILRTINNEIIPVIERIRPLNVSLPQVYPFASDKNLILTLEEQMNIQKNDLRKTEKTGGYISQIHLNAKKPLFIVLTFVFVIPIFIIFITICLIYRHRPNSNNSPTTTVNDSTTMYHRNRSTSNAMRDSSGSIYDLLMAFAKNKADKT